MDPFKTMSDDYLRKNYVPDVYQKDIYAIEYEKLRAAGIKLLSFDVDDTLAPLEDVAPPKSATTLFENLKSMGFEVILLTNARDSRAGSFAKKLGIPGQYIARAEKPATVHFSELQSICGLERSQMAHIGNSITDDVAGGNAFGITTCLVRRVGNLTWWGGKIAVLVGRNEGHELREELKKRGIWRKHHKYEGGDQYYQLGEEPPYRRKDAQETE